MRFSVTPGQGEMRSAESYRAGGWGQPGHSGDFLRRCGRIGAPEKAKRPKSQQAATWAASSRGSVVPAHEPHQSSDCAGGMSTLLEFAFVKATRSSPFSPF